MAKAQPRGDRSFGPRVATPDHSPPNARPRSPGAHDRRGDWFHVCGEDYYSDWRRWDSFPSRIEKTFLELLDLLEEGGHRATIFFLGWVARNRPHLVREAVRRGHEAAVHGDRHRRADEMTLAEFREDLRRARASIEDAAGAACTTHRAARVGRSAAFPCRSGARDPLGGGLSLRRLRDARAAARPVRQPARPLSGGGDRRRNRRDPSAHRPGFGRRLPVGGGMAVPAAPGGTDRFGRAGLPRPGPSRGLHVPPVGIRRGPSPDGRALLLRTVHFLGLRVLPDRFRRWLSRDRSVALKDVLGSLEAA